MKSDLKLVFYPDPRLRIKAEPIAVIDDDVRQLAEGMLQYMKLENGVGLAAPQVGISLRLFVMSYEDEGIPPTALINPRIASSSGTILMTEGCLSFPGLFATLKRPENVVVEALDIHGAPYKIEAGGVLARVIQHEFDHLDGRLFIDLFSPAQKIRYKPILKELERVWEKRKKV